MKVTAKNIRTVFLDTKLKVGETVKRAEDIRTSEIRKVAMLDHGIGLSPDLRVTALPDGYGEFEWQQASQALSAALKSYYEVKQLILN